MDDQDYKFSNYCVPDFGCVTKQSDTSPITSSNATSSATIPLGLGTPFGSEEHQLAELILDKGRPAIQRITPRKLGPASLPLPSSITASAALKMAEASKPFTEEDELLSWLQCFPDEVTAEEYLLGEPKGVTSSQSNAAVSSFNTTSTSVSPPELGAAQAEHGRGSTTASSSSGGGSGTAELLLKRKAAVSYDLDAPSEEFEEMDEKAPKKSSRRTRLAEVHNLSERKRRDKINEKMKALREIIPRCNKRDKASMLDDAIEYTKSLQLQLKMMSMGCNMAPMMYSHMQQYSSASGAELPIRMEQNSGYAGTPVLPFSTLWPGSAPYSGTGFPMQPFHPSPMVFTGLPSSEDSNQRNTAPDMVQPFAPNPECTTQLLEPLYHQYFSNRFPQVLNQAPSVQQNKPSNDAETSARTDPTKNAKSVFRLIWRLGSRV